ncbi:MAG: membrane dipeptidase [Thermodesulfobacteriota bacterium]
MPDRAHGPWVDLHAHPGRCFVDGLTGNDLILSVLGPHACDEAYTGMVDAGMAAVSVATVPDIKVLGLVGSGPGAVRDFEPGEAYADHRRQLDAVARFAGRALRVVHGAADVEAAHASGVPALWLCCEGGDFAEGRLDRIAEVHAAGVRSITLVHYRVNELGDIQTAPPVHDGLTAFGREVVREMNRLGMVIDLAHATFATTRDALAVSTHPVMVSHSHLDHADRSHPRLLSDEHARAVADAGGLIGAWPSGVTSATLADFVDEIARLVDVVGVPHVAIGTDLDANVRPVLTRYAEFRDVAAALATRGMTAAEIDAVLGGNALALIRAVCG